jgi:hypothetical protein
MSSDVQALISQQRKSNTNRPLFGVTLMSKLLTLDEAARKFHLHQATLYRYLKLGYLKRYKKRLDRHTYVDSRELDELLKRPHFEPKEKGPGKTRPS